MVPVILLEKISVRYSGRYQYRLQFSRSTCSLVLGRRQHRISSRNVYETGAFVSWSITLGCGSIPSKNAIRSIADFKGIKMRAPEGMGKFDYFPKNWCWGLNTSWFGGIYRIGARQDSGY